MNFQLLFFAPVLLMCLALFWRDRPNEEMLRSEIRSVLILNNNVGAPSLPGAKWKLFGYRIIWWFGILYIHLLVCTVKWSPLARIFQFSLDVSSFVVGSVGLLYAFHPRYSPPRGFFIFSSQPMTIMSWSASSSSHHSCAFVFYNSTSLFNHKKMENLSDKLSFRRQSTISVSKNLHRI